MIVTAGILALVIDRRAACSTLQTAPPPRAAPGCRRRRRHRPGVRSDGSRWYSASTSRMTRYWLRWVKIVEIWRCEKALLSALSMSCTLHAEPRRGGAVDDHVGLQAALLAVGGDVDDAGDVPDALLHPRHPRRELLGVGIDQGELVLRAALPAADIGQLLRRPHEDPHAGDVLRAWRACARRRRRWTRRRARPAA